MSEELNLPWYPVPAYGGAGGHAGSPHILDRDGQLVATFECLAHAESVCARVNSDKGDHHIPDDSDGVIQIPGWCIPNRPVFRARVIDVMPDPTGATGFELTTVTTGPPIEGGAL